jgi:hypothetical protein
MGNGCIDPHFLNLGTNWRWVVSFTPLPLYTRGKSPRYPLDRRLGGPESRSGIREDNSWPYWDSNSDPSVVQPDYAIPALYTLYMCCIYIEWSNNAAGCSNTIFLNKIFFRIFFYRSWKMRRPGGSDLTLLIYAMSNLGEGIRYNSTE